jgi:N-acetylmuramoyl-L-alanine amidase
LQGHFPGPGQEYLETEVAKAGVRKPDCEGDTALTVAPCLTVGLADTVSEVSTMAKYHIVEQGEYISKIAKKHGFSDYRTIWDDSNNAELKKKRQNPNVLFPGDRLFIPDKGEKEESRSTEQRHRFQVKKPKLKLRLVLEDIYEKPIANAKCELTVEGETHQTTTNGKGQVEQEIPATAEHALLVIKDAETPVKDEAIPIKIGHLDPVEEFSGQKARLNNLGYYAGPLEERDEMLFRLAVEEFQCEHGLKVDGVCGSQTQAKLKEAHGC